MTRRSTGISSVQKVPIDELLDFAYKGTKRDLIKHYRLGWSMGDEQDLVDCFERQLLGREITSYEYYMKFLGDVHYALRRFGYDFRDLRMKVESIANLYAQFKLFVFKTPGVKYNFLTNKSIVTLNTGAIFVKNEMVIDPMELLYDASPPTDEEPEQGGDFISTTEAITEWTTNRDLLAHQLFAEWNQGN
ncbi:hypothetical protein ACS0TY_024095 [Phlomoides rotata]